MRGNDGERRGVPTVHGEILREQPFVRMLCMERSRTERSARPFVLMLLESVPHQTSGDDGQVLEKVLHVLSCSTRETDVKGWYKDDTVIGVIFTELGSAQRGTVVDLLLTRTTNLLSGILSVEQVNELRLSFHGYPEDSLKHGPGGPPHLPLHPELEEEMKGRKAARFLKRSMDIVGSLLALILSSPLLLAISVVIRLTSRGPVFFRQERVGLCGRRFTFLKFRSMYFANDSTIHEKYIKHLISGTIGAVHAAGSQKPVYKLANDPRVTSVGRLLRRSSLDELPQFLNVLAGEMSLVGPRPSIPYEFDCYSIWHMRRLLAVKPGITGLWQVRGRGRIKFDEMVRLDIRYAKSWSLWLDLKILWRTPRVVVSGEGAY